MAGENNGAAGQGNPADPNGRRTRNQGNVAAAHLEQLENLAALAAQCARGRNLVARPAEQRPTLNQVQRKIVTLERLWSECDWTHRDLLTMSELPDVAAYLAGGTFTSARDAYYDIVERLEGLVDIPQQRPPADQPAPDQPVRPQVSTLERLPVPTFEGSLKEWPNFRDMFTVLVIDDAALSNVYKLSYLKRSLKGNALALIKNIEINADNFARAWKIVTDHYQNVNSLTFSYITRLLQLDPVDSRRPGQLERLFIQTREILASLESLNEPIESWSSLLVVLTVLRLDHNLRQDWEHSVGRRETFPTFNELEAFLQTRIHAESLSSLKSSITFHSSSASPSKSTKASGSNIKVNSYVSNSSIPSCLVCNSSEHVVQDCPVLRNIAVRDRLAKIKSLRICANCFRKGHFPRDCRSNSRCAQCTRRHHTLLHESFALERPISNSQPPMRNEASAPPTHETVATNTAAQLSVNVGGGGRNVLLATALIRVATSEGRVLTLRALIDQGSERSLLSESAAQQLCVVRRSVNASIVGIGGQASCRVKHSSRIRISPVVQDHPTIEVDCLILGKLTSYAPRSYTVSDSWRHVCHLSLADPELHSNRAIDILLGADVYGDIIREGLLRFPGEPIAQLTVFGWILSGPCNDSRIRSDRRDSEPVINSLHVITNSDLTETLCRFWEIEETPGVKFLTPDEQKCEEIFINTTRRDSSGRYTVNLPFVTSLPIDIGNSYETAYKQYSRLDRRLTGNPMLHAAYSKFLQEYLELGHMSPYTPRSDNEQTYFIPHHPVMKESSSTTKLRVVFNASCQTSNGKSLNDNLLIGPKLQLDLSSIILRWRTHHFAMVADAEKMFRQIRVVPEHSSFQLILWRPRVNEPIQTFRLETVTYGTASAPFLSLRVLHQLAADERERFPLAAHEIVESTYVDDIVFGSSTVEETRLIRDQVRSLTNSGGFLFRKWISNDPSLVSDLPIDLRDSVLNKEFKLDDSRKVLGISWVTTEDTFKYSSVPECPSHLTKRTVLSFIAKLYDPLGWIAPVVILAKIFMQQLWLTKVDWDDPIPSHLVSKWTNFNDELRHLTDVRIPRWIGSSQDSLIQLHMFCDASKDAYAATIYVRVDNGGEIVTHLLVSKTKVAPIKSVTIPRLELCAAELGSRLVAWTMDSLKRTNIPTFAWSDSEVALRWISDSPSRWKLFVANRVSRIQTRTPELAWQYVPTALNPADLASRGCTASSIIDHDLWWFGPSWLKHAREAWPCVEPKVDPAIDCEERPLAVHHVQLESMELSQRSSDWGKLIRAVATMLRYKDILLSKARKEPLDQLRTPSSQLILDYRDQARILLIKIAQSQCFKAEIQVLKSGGTLQRRNRLISLTPYLDNHGILRVGGRLDNSALLEDSKHPILLSKNPLTRLIIKHAHLRTLHGGLSLTTRLLAEQYWVFRSKSLVRSEILKCVVCVRYRASVLSQKMAPLPSYRVNRRRAFQHVGIDYAGPIAVKFGSGRGHRAHKAYISVFVCLSTRAIHLELVNAYTTDAFLAAFKRFCSRRGLPSLVVSDNGTNFHGASRSLTQDFKKVLADPRISATLAEDQVEWKFIPPGAPHFGGMWESGVKSVKHHLRRVMGAHTLDVEEFSTLLCQIEACLNSRPIAGLSNNPDDLSYLTPGHFLIGTALLAPPEPSVAHIKEGRLSRWQAITSMNERFWKVWSCDYLRSLQTRNKWRLPQSNVKEGAIVLLKDENMPPAKWALGRVVRCHPGNDGYTRVCDIRTATTTLTRPVHKLCLLPTDGDAPNEE